VCRIESGEKLFKTGFLVHNAFALTSGADVPLDAFARFDYSEVDGKVVSPGTAVRIVGVRSINPTERIQIVLLQLERSIGYEPAYGDRDTRSRGFFHLWERREIQMSDPVVWLWHEGALKMGGSLKVRPDKELIAFSVRPRSAFEGAPCFDMDLNLVALHCGENPYKRGECIARTAGSLADDLHEILPRDELA
jgi:hypothetical protein